MFIDIDAVVAEISDCTMLDEMAQRLGRNVETIMGRDCIEIVTAAGTVLISNRYSDGRRDIVVEYV